MANAFVQDPPYIRNQKPGKIDFLGFGLMALGLSSMELTLDLGQQYDWFESPFIVFTTVMAALAIIAFICWELYTPEPIVNLRVFLNRNFAVGTILIAAVGVVLYGSTALLPLFLQTTLGYSAVNSGLAVSPRGLGSMVSMIIVGRLIGKIDSRYLIMFGFAVLAYSTFMFTNINLEISSTSVSFPMIISGFAMGFVFVPLTTLTMGTLTNEQIGNASGIYNLMRNTGGSFGIAAMTALLARNQQIHQAQLVTHTTPYDPAFQRMFDQIAAPLIPQIGLEAATQQAYQTIYAMVVQQAAVLSYIDNFRLLGILCVLAVPTAFLFKRVRRSKAPVDMH